MKFGLFLANQFHRRLDVSAELRRLVETVHLVRESPWHSVWVGHHYLTSEYTQIQPFPLLARLIPESGELGLGVGVLQLAIGHPVEIAETASSLDHLAGGRLILGLGMGYRDVEFRAYGVRPQEKRHRFEENLGIVRSLLAGESVTRDLDWCELSQARVSALPVRAGGPKIVLAGTADRAVERAAGLGLPWLTNPAATMIDLEAQAKIYRRQLPAGASAEVLVFREIFCADSSEEAWETALPILSQKYEAYAAWGQEASLRGDRDLRLDPSTLAADRFIIGDPDACAEKLLEYAKRLGASGFVLRTQWPGLPGEKAEASLRLLTDSVLPFVSNNSRGM